MSRNHALWLHKAPCLVFSPTARLFCIQRELHTLMVDIASILVVNIDTSETSFSGAVFHTWLKHLL